jgi:hypothetical protein
MSTLSTVARNAACDAVTALAGGGKLKIKDSAVVLATLTLPATSHDAAVAGVATMRGGDGTNPIGAGNPLEGTGAADGVADNYDITTAADAVLWSGTVGQGSGELDLVNVNIATGQPIELTSGSHTQPAS